MIDLDPDFISLAKNRNGHILHEMRNQTRPCVCGMMWPVSGTWHSFGTRDGKPIAIVEAKDGKIGIVDLTISSFRFTDRDAR